MPYIRRQVCCQVDEATDATIDDMAEVLGRKRSQVAADLIDQGLRALRAASDADSRGDDPAAAALAAVAADAYSPDPVVLALVDALNDRLDRAAETSPTQAARQAREVAGATAAWSAFTAHGQDDDAGVAAAILDPVGTILDHLAPQMEPGQAADLAKSIGEWMFKVADERWAT